MVPCGQSGAAAERGGGEARCGLDLVIIRGKTDVNGNSYVLAGLSC